MNDDRWKAYYWLMDNHPELFEIYVKEVEEEE